MQVFGLPGQTIRNGRATSLGAAAWRTGLTSDQAAKAVGVQGSNLYR